MHGMVAFEITTLKNYRGVGLEFDNGKKYGTINAHWSVWQPKLRAWLTMGLVILLCLLLSLRSSVGEGGQPR